MDFFDLIARRESCRDFSPAPVEREKLIKILEAGIIAPSACNSQPWLVRNEGELSVFRYKKPGKRGIMPVDKVSYYNRIDIGIFLCFLDILLSHKGIAYKRELFNDDGEDREFTLNARYVLNT